MTHEHSQTPLMQISLRAHRKAAERKEEVAGREQDYMIFGRYGQKIKLISEKYIYYNMAIV